MFAAGKTAAVSGAGPDAQFNYVTMLLHGDGTNGAQNNTFLDSSTNNFTITRNGNTTQGSFSPYGSNWSNYFNGSSSTPLNFPDNNGFTFDADFTIEAWVFLSSTSAFQIVVSKWDVGGQEWIIAVDSGGVAEFHWAPYSDAVPAIESSSGAVSANQWTHLAAVRSGSTITLYVNGTSVGTRTNGTAGTNRTTLVTVGYLQYLGGDKLTGYVSNLRIVKGTAVYTATFTPSTTPLTAITNTQLLTCQSNRFVDNSTNNFTATVNGVTVQRFNPFGTSTAYSTSVIGGSGYFDGTTDYLTVSQQTALSFSTGDFSIEAWVYPQATVGFFGVIDARNSSAGSGDQPWIFGLSDRTGYKVELFLSDAARYYGSITVPLNCWTHIAVSRVSGTLKSFVNGVVDYNASMTSAVNANGTTQSIGRIYDPAYITGYLTDVRVVKGSGYSSLTVPTAPLTAITNTQLLLNMTNGAIFDNAMMNDLETVGNAQISTSVKKYGTGSLAFDGTGDCLKPNPATTDLYAFSSGDFTIEMWFYITAFTNTYSTLFDSRPVSTQGSYPTIAITSGRLYYYVSSAERIATANSAITTGQWYHLAVSRSGTSTKMFLDGTQVGSTYTDSTVYVNGTSRPVIGAEGFNSPPNDVINGYIDDLRITKGYARYTANFTAPTAAFSDTGPY